MGAICFDTRFHVIAREPSQQNINDYHVFDTSGIVNFIAEKFSRFPDGKNVFYTFAWHENLVSNIVLLEKDNQYIGAFVSQAVFIKRLSPAEKEQVIVLTCASKNAHPDVLDYYNIIPVVSPESVTNAGEIMTSLSHFIIGGIPAAQAASDITAAHTTDKNKNISVEQTMNETVFQALMRLEYANYLRLKECIQTGSVSELEKALDEITLFPNEPEGLAASVYMRSIKTRGIRICTLAGYIAIESNAPYHKVLNISEKTVIQLEHAESLARVSDLVRKTITDITRVVEVERMQSYSKPVRQVLAYIREHYAEKITLSLLAERTELSTFYLSTLIKKETGLSLTDHINMTRIEESKRMLLDENASIIEVADRVGFLYQNHFSTVFKKITGMTPTEFIQSRDRSEY